MKKDIVNRNAFIASLVFIVNAIFLGGCISEQKDCPKPSEKLKESTVLIYAVATNSLSYNLVKDKNEMIEAARKFDVEKNNVLVFETQYYYNEENVRESHVRLLKLSTDKASASGYGWHLEKEFIDEVPSLQPSRVSEIIDYVSTNYKAEHYGLVFWSHSTGSQPYLPPETKSSLPEAYSFGQDKTQENPYVEINVDALANALPDHMFDFIWFDSCYMANIESVYQFRNKCKMYVGYPTEVLDEGMPYQLVLPYMVGKNADIIEGARQFFNFYENSIATIGVVDMSKLDILTNFCSKIYAKGNEVAKNSMIQYTRYTTGPFYDLGDYTKAMAAAADNEITKEEWNEILDQCVVYKAATERDFSYKNIDPERYSGLSTHSYSFGDQDSDVESFYKNLDWFKTVF